MCEQPHAVHFWDISEDVSVEEKYQRRLLESAYISLSGVWWFICRVKRLPFDCTLSQIYSSKFQCSINMPSHAAAPVIRDTNGIFTCTAAFKCPDHSLCHKRSAKAALCLIKKTRFTWEYIPPSVSHTFQWDACCFCSKRRVMEFQMAA